MVVRVLFRSAVLLAILVSASAVNHFAFRSHAAGHPPSPGAEAKHGLTGSYYISNWDKDVPPPAGAYAQVWHHPNDFGLPRIFTAPVATRVDSQVAFGQGKGFSAKNPGPPVIWWPTAPALPVGWTAKNVWDYFAAVIWKGYIHFPKAGTYYFGTVSNGGSAVYLNQARVALNGNYGGVLVGDAFGYAKQDIQQVVQFFPSEDVALAPDPRVKYVIPIPIDAPRDLPIEVRYNPSGHFTHSASEPFGVDLFWVTPDSPRDSNGKPVASIVPSEALYTEAPGPIEKPVVRSANSTISADFLYFPVQSDNFVTVTVRLADKDGNPARGKRVSISTVGDVGQKYPDNIIQPDKPTDENGETTAKIRANQTYAGPHDAAIFATDVTDFVDVAQVGHVTFEKVAGSFFPDTFSPYYDPHAPEVTPMPLQVGRQVTVKMPLVNRNKYAADLDVIFEIHGWNIGASDWNEIGRVKNVRLQPGEHKDVSIQWTPDQSTGHICFRVGVNATKLIAAATAPQALSATLLPIAFDQGGTAQQGSRPNGGVKTDNKGAVEPGASDDCDPSRYNKEASEQQAGKDLLDASLKQQKEAHQELKDWVWPEAKVIAEKQVILKLIEKTMSSGGKVVFKVGVDGILGIPITIIWITTDVYPHIRDYNREMRTSGDMADAGAKLLEESAENLKKGLEQAGRCRQQWAKQDENERLHEAAKKLRDSWELEGGRDLYKDPNDPNPYPMDAAKALKRAEEILSKSSHPMSTPIRPKRPHVVLVNVAQNETNVELTTEQLQAALREMDSALDMLAAGRREMEKKEAYEEQFVAQVRALLELLGGWEQDSAGAAALADEPAYLMVAQGYAQNAVLSQLKSRADEAGSELKNTLDKDSHCDEKCRGEQMARISRLSQLSRALDSTGKHSMTLAQIPPDSMFHRLTVADSDTSEGYLDATSRSIARYRGAVAAADTQWMSRHLTAARLYWGRLGTTLRREAEIYQREAEQIHAKQQQGVSEIEAVMNETKRRVRQNVRFGPTELAALGTLRTQEAERRAISTDRSPVSNPGGAAESLRSLLLTIASVDKQFAEYESRIASAPLSFADPAKQRGALSQTYAVANPHDRQEILDLFIRPISIPPDWKLSIVNAKDDQTGQQGTKPGEQPKYPVRELDPGKHYNITLPAKTETRVASVVIPVGEVGARTTARWAVEGKIGNELIGGMVHEMNVPYIIADLQLPPVGSKEVEEELPVPGRPWARIVTEIAAAVVVLGLLMFFFIFWRRRHQTETPRTP